MKRSWKEIKCWTICNVLLGSVFAHTVEAELHPIDDAAMASITGQAGLTLEIDMEVKISELAYHDKGYLGIENFIWGGADRTGSTGVTGAFENWKMVIDVAGDNESLAYGFSELDQYHSQVASPDAAWDAAIHANDDPFTASDGDLVFHNTSRQLFDGTRYDWASDSNVALAGGATSSPSSSFVETMDDWRNSAPFAIQIGSVKLHDSSYEVGSKTPGGTVLMSNFIAEVLTGPLDIIIQNHGGGSTHGVPDSKILISDYFEISDLRVDFDFLNISVEGVKFHNRRGDTTGLNTNSGLDGIKGNADDRAVESFGFAHMKWYIAAAPDPSDGLQIGGAIKGDLDVSTIYLGDNGHSIGSVYITDMTIASSLNIRGH